MKINTWNETCLHRLLVIGESMKLAIASFIGSPKLKVIKSSFNHVDAPMCLGLHCVL